MGTITVTMDDETETLFRETVQKEYGTGKGVLGKAISEAANRWVTEKQQREIAERQLALLKKGFFMGKKLYKNRDELYEHRTRWPPSPH